MGSVGPLGRHTGLTVADGASGTASSSSARSPWNVLGLNWKEKRGGVWGGSWGVQDWFEGAHLHLHRPWGEARCA